LETIGFRWAHCASVEKEAKFEFVEILASDHKLIISHGRTFLACNELFASIMESYSQKLI